MTQTRPAADAARGVALGPNPPAFNFAWTREGRISQASGEAGDRRTPWAPDWALYRFARDEDPVVRAAVVKNPSTPIELLRTLSEEDTSLGMKLCLGQNHRTPADILEKLATDKSERVRFVVAQNSSTPAKTLEQLEKDEVSLVRAGVGIRRRQDAIDAWVREQSKPIKSD